MFKRSVLLQFSGVHRAFFAKYPTRSLKTHGEFLVFVVSGVLNRLTMPVFVSGLLCFTFLYGFTSFTGNQAFAMEKDSVEKARSDLYRQVLTTGKFGSEVKVLTDAKKVEKAAKVDSVNKSISNAVGNLRKKHGKSNAVKTRYPSNGLNKGLHERKTGSKSVGQNQNAIKNNQNNSLTRTVAGRQSESQRSNSDQKEIKVDLPKDFKNEIHFP